MARPDAATAAARAERKQKWARVRAEAAEAKETIRVQIAGMAGDIVPTDDEGRPSTPQEIRSMLRRAFHGAMLTEQWMACEKVAMSLAKFDNLYVERSQTALAVGTPDQFKGSAEEAKQMVLERVRQKYGLAGEERFLRFAEEMRRLHGPDGRLLEHEAGDGE